MDPSILTAGQARDLFNYDPDTGIFTRKSCRFRSKTGAPVGSAHSKGYVEIRIQKNGRAARYYAHRLAWLYMTGAWPSGQIDHINGIRNDNRFCNLRDVSQSINMLNQRAPQRSNTTGFLGVHRVTRSKKYSATIRWNGRNVSVGYFVRPEDAHEMYLKAKKLVAESTHADSVIDLVLSEDLKPDARGRLIDFLL